LQKKYLPEDMKMYELIRSKVEDINKIKTVIPKIILECQNNLSTRLPSNLTYLDLKKFYTEPNGDVDYCNGHYQISPRTKGKNLEGGKIFFSYKQREAKLDISVDSQEPTGEKEIHKLIEKIKRVLNVENIQYQKIIKQD
jgi:hypothetical protein